MSEIQLTQEQKDFVRLYTILSEEFGESVSKARMKMHYDLIFEEGITIGQLESAVKTILKERKFNKMPKIGEILEAAKGQNNVEDKAYVALRELEDAMLRHGPYSSVCFEDKTIMAVVQSWGGWDTVCNMPSDEWKFKRNEFLKAYPAFKRSNAAAPSYLIGWSEHQQRVGGYSDYADNQQIAMIGSFAIEGKKVLSIPAGMFNDVAPAIGVALATPKNNVEALIAGTIKRIEG